MEEDPIFCALVRAIWCAERVEHLAVQDGAVGAVWGGWVVWADFMLFGSEGCPERARGGGSRGRRSLWCQYVAPRSPWGRWKGILWVVGPQNGPWWSGSEGHFGLREENGGSRSGSQPSPVNFQKFRDLISIHQIFSWYIGAFQRAAPNSQYTRTRHTVNQVFLRHSLPGPGM